MSDEIVTECIVCGAHLNAGTYPPCCDACRDDWELECKFNYYAKLEAKDYTDVRTTSNQNFRT